MCNLRTTGRLTVRRPTVGGQKKRLYASLICIGAAVAISAVMISMFVFLPTKLIWNASASMAVGLYWIEKSDLKRSDIVLIWLPKTAQKIAHERSYLPSHVPALKRIHGLQGDHICRQNQDIFLNHRHIAIARIQDGLGRKMPVWQGCKPLKTGEAFLLGDHPHSFDSRYFGPVKRNQIIGTARPLWTR